MGIRSASKSAPFILVARDVVVITSAECGMSALGAIINPAPGLPSSAPADGASCLNVDLELPKEEGILPRFYQPVLALFSSFPFDREEERLTTSSHQAATRRRVENAEARTQVVTCCLGFYSGSALRLLCGKRRVSHSSQEHVQGPSCGAPPEISSHLHQPSSPPSSTGHRINAATFSVMEKKYWRRE